MRLSRISASLVVVVMLLAGLHASSAQAQDAKAKQVAAAYKKARQLYRQGKYRDAIRAFDEVKDLRYHPILDYGIANCYESLRDFDKAIYYLEKYVRNYPKFKMSPKHPAMVDVKEKIKVLNRRAASATGGGEGDAVPPPPGNGDAVPGTPASGGTADADPVPGPDPYAVPPPPGGGSTGGVYGEGGSPPPPGQVVRRRKEPARRAIIFSVDVGAAAFAASDGYSVTNNTGTGGGIFITAAWRFIPWLAIGLHGGVSAMGSEEYCDGSGCHPAEPVYFANVNLEGRGILPLGSVDFWGSLGVGYATAGQSVDDLNSVSVSGPSFVVGLGMDWFLSPTLSLGIMARIYRIFPNRWCSNDVCGSMPADVDPGVSWYAGLGATYHLPLTFGRK